MFGNAIDQWLRVVDPLPDPSAFLTSGERAVVDECLSAAEATVSNSDPEMFELLEQYDKDISARTVADPRGQAATEASNACVRDLGFPSGDANQFHNEIFDQGAAVVDRFQNGELSRDDAIAQLHEIGSREDEMAPRLEECIVDMVAVQREIRYEFELELLSERGEEIRAAVESILADQETR